MIVLLAHVTVLDAYSKDDTGAQSFIIAIILIIRVFVLEACKDKKTKNLKKF